MTAYTIALAGNPNSGKTTVFNRLTGGNQTTGNWPGVTVERVEGRFRHQGEEVRVVDLPGTYSLTSYSLDEKVARDYLLKEHPDLVVAVVDATNLERNLYLVLQMQDLGLRVVVALNMMDEAREKGLEIDHIKLGRLLRCRVVPVVGTQGMGITQLKEAILQRVKLPVPEYPEHFPEEVGKPLKQMEEIIAAAGVPYPARFSALKAAENDGEFLKLLENHHCYEQVKAVMDAFRYHEDDLSTAIAELRYGYIHGLYKECVVEKSSLAGRISFSDQVDKLLTNRWLGIPLFLFFMWLTFQLIFTLGNPLADLLGGALDWLGSHLATLLTNGGAPTWFTSFLTESILGGVGAILVFVPNIFILFTIIALLGDTGYMSRAAFVMDRFMHAMGLHGKSFIPMILGFGCNVPAIMSTRTLESRKDRILTILVNPLMSCSARLPVYILFTGIFFREHQGLVVASFYIIGIVLAVVVAKVFQLLIFREDTAPLIMELPPYRMPNLRLSLRQSWTQTYLFIRKAGTVILLGVFVIWLLASLPRGVEYAGAESYIGRIGHFLSPLLAPAGFGFWQATVALIFGILAKEVVVGTLGTLYAGGNLSAALATAFTPLSAYTFMLMTLVYIPCVATIAVIRKEIGTRWAVLTTAYSLALGWGLAIIVYQVGSRWF